MTPPTDVTMTVLLSAALAGAALVLSHVLRQMPLDDVERRRLATSWLAHNIRRAFFEPGRRGIRRRPERRAAGIAPRTEGEGRS